MSEKSAEKLNSLDTRADNFIKILKSLRENFDYDTYMGMLYDFRNNPDSRQLLSIIENRCEQYGRNDQYNELVSTVLFPEETEFRKEDLTKKFWMPIGLKTNNFIKILESLRENFSDNTYINILHDLRAQRDTYPLFAAIRDREKWQEEEYEYQKSLEHSYFPENDIVFFDENVPKTLVMHGGAFRADDVLCAALLYEVNSSLEIRRVFSAPKDVANSENYIIVADTGEVEFNHHQLDVPLREDGHKHAACWSILEEYKDYIFGWWNSPPPALLEDVRRIEDANNGVKTGENSVLTELVSLMNPNWDSKISSNEAFRDAVSFVSENYVSPYKNYPRIPEKNLRAIQKRLDELKQEREIAEARAHEIVESAISKSDGNIISLPRFVPWKDDVCKTNASFVIYPSRRGGYNLQCVPKTSDSFKKRIPIPYEWLKERPEGCNFVHQGRFLAAFDSYHHALNAAESAIKKARNEKIMNTMKSADSLDDILCAIRDDASAYETKRVTRPHSHKEVRSTGKRKNGSNTYSADDR